MGYAAGEVVMLRDIRNGVAYFEWPVTVVEDGERGLLVSQVPGAVGRVPRGYPDDMAVLVQQLASGSPERVDLEWRGTRTLGVLLPDQWWAARLFWTGDDRRFLGYYVDFVRPIERDGDSVNTLDLALDIVIAPDLTWHWKDEDQVQLLRDLGWLDSATEAEMESAKADVLAAIAARRYPFDGSLLSLCP
jgi:predicted RNA-binding protein associated with RNAse of E/G family